MVSESVAETVLIIILAVGAPLLVVLFYAEGLIVGKLVQPPAVFVAYVSVTRPAVALLLAVCLACVVAASLGQWTIYRGFHEDAPHLFGLRKRVPVLRALPATVENRVGDRQMRFVERTVESYGGVGICLLNVVPGIRGLAAIPAGLSGYPRGRFLIATTVGNVAYFGVLVGVSYGILEVAGLVA